MALPLLVVLLIRCGVFNYVKKYLTSTSSQLSLDFGDLLLSYVEIVPHFPVAVAGRRAATKH